MLDASEELLPKIKAKMHGHHRSRNNECQTHDSCQPHEDKARLLNKHQFIG